LAFGDVDGGGYHEGDVDVEVEKRVAGGYVYAVLGRRTVAIGLSEWARLTRVVMLTTTRLLVIVAFVPPQVFESVVRFAGEREGGESAVCGLCRGRLLGGV